MVKTDSDRLAVVEVNGSQQLVVEGDHFIVNRMSGEVEETVKAKNLLNDEPVTLKIIAHTLGDKINGLKFKNKVRYLKRYGHRQMLTKLEVIKIGALEKTVAKEVDKEVTPKPKKKAAKK